MRPHPLRATTLSLGLLALVACTRDDPKVRPDSTAIAKVTRPDSAPTTPAPAIDSATFLVGTAVYLPADGGAASVVLPAVADDSVPAPTRATVPAAAAPAQVDLFAPDGASGTMAVGAYSAGQQPDLPSGCDAWPVVSLRTETGSGKRWRVALPAGLATALPMSAIETRASRDSSTLAAQITRATANLVDDPASVFRRIPYDVLSAWQASLAGDTSVVLAILERRVNSEAMQRAERTVAVLERAPGAKGYALRWKDVQSGSEDEMVSVDLLAAVRHGRASLPTIFLGLDFGDGSRLQMLQRSAGGWRLVWSSAYTGC